MKALTLALCALSALAASTIAAGNVIIYSAEDMIDAVKFIQVEHYLKVD